MNNPDTEILFPFRVVPDLEAIRGKSWQSHVQFILSDDSSQLDRLAFVLSIVKIAGCVSCNSNSFRAMRGCTQCSVQAVRRYRDSDAELIDLYEESRNEVEEYLSKNGYHPPSYVRY
jgi:hypothetical protein